MHIPKRNHLLANTITRGVLELGIRTEFGERGEEAKE